MADHAPGCRVRALSAIDLQSTIRGSSQHSFQTFIAHPTSATTVSARGSSTTCLCARDSACPAHRNSYCTWTVANKHALTDAQSLFAPAERRSLSWQKTPSLRTPSVSLARTRPAQIAASLSFGSSKSVGARPDYHTAPKTGGLGAGRFSNRRARTSLVRVASVSPLSLLISPRRHPPIHPRCVGHPSKTRF